MQVHIIKEIIKNKDEKSFINPDNPNLQQDKSKGKTVILILEMTQN